MVADTDISILKNREFFPRGLLQSEEGFRFSMDSLLLACFATSRPNQRGADLGCGCGGVGLGMLLRCPSLDIHGLELDPQVAALAHANGARLGLADRFRASQGDVADFRADRVLDFVVANPPYREPGTGRENVDHGRRTARFEEAGSFETFARCAARNLKTRGRFAVVHLAERLPELMVSLNQAGLAPKRMRLIHGRADEPARLVLLEAVKSGGAGLAVEPPLILYSGRSEGSALTRQAMAFCPFLACNAKEKGNEHE